MKKSKINKLLLEWGYRAITESGTLIAFNKIKFLFIGSETTLDEIVDIKKCNEGFKVYIQITIDEIYEGLIPYTLDDDIERLRDWMNFGIYSNKYYIDDLNHIGGK